MTLAPFPSLDTSLLFVSVDIPAGRVRLTGEFDRGSAHLLIDALPVLASGTAETWSVDAAAVTYCDGGGLAALVRARQVAEAHGRQLRIVGASRCVRRLVEVTGVADLLALAPLLR